MTKSVFDIIVLGVGAMGAAACATLAERGHRVLGIDRFGIPNTRGSSHGASRAFRIAYFEHPDYVPLLIRSHELWRRLATKTGRELLTETGAVLIGDPESDLIRGTIDSADRHRLDVIRYDADSLAERMPEFRPPEGFVGVEEREAGVLYPEGAVSALAELAMSRGATLRAHERVVRWSAGEHAVTVETEHDQFSADRLVVCSGAWTLSILTDLGLPLSVTRQAQCWFAPLAPESFRRGEFPVWAIQHADAAVYYGFPILPGRPGLKTARHVPGDAADPDRLDREARAEDSGDLWTLLESTIPNAAGSLLAVEICMYTNTPDGHFIIDRHPTLPAVTFACGFSGHGFKFTPVVGEILADLATEETTPLPADFLSMRRFNVRGGQD